MAQMSQDEINQRISENEVEEENSREYLVQAFANIDMSDMFDAVIEPDVLNSIVAPVPPPNSIIPSPLILSPQPQMRPRLVGRPVSRRRFFPDSQIPSSPLPLIRQVGVTTGCNHELTRGPRRGQPCNKRFHRNSDYCRTHYRRYVSSPVRQQVHSPVYVEEKQDHSHLLYKSCSMCNHKVEGPKVILECECEYHLNCYMMVQHEKKCFKCGDKVHKTEDDYHDCAICLEKIKIDGMKTGCNHEFHKQCINSWVRMGTGNCHQCPLCRADL